MGKFIAPKDVNSLSVQGQQFDVGTDGTFEADDSFTAELVSIGCTSAPEKAPEPDEPEELKVGDSVLFPNDEDPPVLVPGKISKITKKTITIDGDQDLVWEFPIAERSSIQKQPE